MKIYEREITSIESLFSAIEDLDNIFNHQIWWRGQRECKWLLEPSAFRNSNENDERARILRFQQRAISRHDNLPPLIDKLDWLFIMQHYRLPTRLLDWTESPLVALFFASEIYECHQMHPAAISDADGALFALSPYLMNENQLGKNGILMPEDPEVINAMMTVFDEAAKENKKVIAIRPSEVDIRLMVQLSVFTINGYRIAIDDLPSSDKFLWKFIVPTDAKKNLRKELQRIGIRLSNIFPDLEHLSEEIRQTTFKPIIEPPLIRNGKIYSTQIRPIEPST